MKSVYSNGRSCTGEVRQFRAYGKNRNGVVAEQDIKKVRLWCSEKDDHAGAVSSSESKNRMEFYPSDLQRLGIYAEVIASCENVEAAATQE